MQLAELSIEDAAKEAAGNWQDFHCFWWQRKLELEDPENWAIIYTHNRDSGLLDQSSAEFISNAMKPFTDTDDPDVFLKVTAIGLWDMLTVSAFGSSRMVKSQPPSNDTTNSQQRWGLSNLRRKRLQRPGIRSHPGKYSDCSLAIRKAYALPDTWVSQVYDWFSENDFAAIENVDDQGGSPSEEQLMEAIESIGFPRNDNENP
jgi:hypothetical protein